MSTPSLRVALIMITANYYRVYSEKYNAVASPDENQAIMRTYIGVEMKRSQNDDNEEEK